MEAEKNTVPVDIGRLGKGLQTAFVGVSEIFGAIGVDEKAAEMINTMDGSVSESVKKQMKAKAEEQKGTEPAAKSDKEAAGASVKPEKESADTQQKSQVTMPEIIKIVTKKIETDRKNSERIGEIVRSFGISKLTDLPEDKYEAFLTQLTAL